VRLRLTVAQATIGLLKKQYSERDGKQQYFIGWRTPNPSPLIRLLDLPQSVRIDRLNLPAH
jgi:hypothetical protein